MLRKEKVWLILFIFKGIFKLFWENIFLVHVHVCKLCAHAFMCLYPPTHIHTHMQSVWVGIWMMQCDLVLSGIKFPWFSFIVSRRHPTKRNFKSRCSLLGVVWSSSVSAFKDAFFFHMSDSVASLSQNKTRFYYGKKKSQI